MFVSCDACRYDSGDFDTPDELARRVNIDGGFMEFQYGPGPDYAPDGWKILCPQRCGEQYVHMD